MSATLPPALRQFARETKSYPGGYPDDESNGGLTFEQWQAKLEFMARAFEAKGEDWLDDEFFESGGFNLDYKTATQAEKDAWRARIKEFEDCRELEFKRGMFEFIEWYGHLWS